VLLDTPGSPSFAGDTGCALEVADLALVVIGPEPERAALAEPILRELEASGVPHAIFVNKIDKARGSIEAVLEALQPMSKPPLVARQIPIASGEEVSGFVDLALDRAWKYRAGQPSEQVPIADELQATESAAHFRMLEHLADHDDYLLEQLLTDQVPDLQTVFGDIKRETADGLIVPIFFGSALNGFGVRRLLKALRHDTPAPATTAARLGGERAAAEVFKISHGSSIGRLALARVFGGTLAEGAELYGPDGKPQRTGSLFAIQGGATTKLAKAGPGEVVGVAKADAVDAGQRLGIGGPATAVAGARVPLVANSAVSIAVKDHKDEVRLSAALNKLVEEDPGLSWDTVEESHETLLHGLSDEHLQVALERLKRRYGVAVSVGQPSVAFRETVRKPASQRGRHKKQSGGHGQYGDVVIEIRPLPRGEGFVFEDKITGGVIPRQYIPRSRRESRTRCSRVRSAAASSTSRSRWSTARTTASTAPSSPSARPDAWRWAPRSRRPRRTCSSPWHTSRSTRRATRPRASPRRCRAIARACSGWSRATGGRGGRRSRRWCPKPSCARSAPSCARTARAWRATRRATTTWRK
jgi:elongation factor G